MNNSDDHITRALRKQADQIQEGSLTMSDITGKARSIQRRRALATVVGAAAVVAVIAPIGIVAMNKGGDNAAPPIATGGTPTSTPSTPSTPPAPGGRTYTVDLTPSDVDGTTGASPTVPLWMFDTIQDAHGTATDVGGVVRNFVKDPTKDEWIGVPFQSSGAIVHYAIPSGQVTKEEPTQGTGIGVTPDGASVAYVTGDGMHHTVLTLLGRHARTWDLANPTASVVGILPNGDVVLMDEAASKLLVAHQDGTIDTQGPFLKATSVSVDGLIAAETSYNQDGTSCWALVDATGSTHGDTCDYALGQFSADGKYVLGMDSDTDGPGPTRLYLLDAATLTPVATFVAPKGGHFSSETAWTGSTILADVWADGQWGLAWLNTDGVKMARSANKPGAGEDLPPYLFGAGPLAPVAP